MENKHRNNTYVMKVYDIKRKKPENREKKIKKKIKKEYRKTTLTLWRLPWTESGKRPRCCLIMSDPSNISFLQIN